MLEPALGDKVIVRARPGQKVQAFAEIHGRFLSDKDWSERLWDEWLHRRWLDGSIEAEHAPADIKPEAPTVTTSSRRSSKVEE